MGKADELRGMGIEQLRVTLRDSMEHLFRLRFQSETEKVEAPSEIKKARREIARLKTVIRELEIAGQTPEE